MCEDEQVGGVEVYPLFLASTTSNRAGKETLIQYLFINEWQLRVVITSPGT